MDSSILRHVRGANSRLRALVRVTRDSLAGRRNFGVEDVRAIAEPVSQMAPLIEEAQSLRTLEPELDGELEAYAGNLGEMQEALEQMRFMLLARRAQMDAMRGHLATVRLWADTLRQTQ
jgi:hypothetical protein